MYLLNTTNLTLLNILLARTGHTELQATPHVNTGAHSLKLGRRSSREVTEVRTKCGSTKCYT